MQTEPNFQRFKELAAAYGARRSQWPPEAHALYDHFCNMPEAQLTLAGAQQIDQFLGQWQPQVRDHEVAARILHALPPQSYAASPTVQMRQWSLPVAVLMLCALLGFGNGYFSSDVSEFTGRDMPAAFGMVEEE